MSKTTLRHRRDRLAQRFPAGICSASIGMIVTGSWRAHRAPLVIKASLILASVVACSGDTRAPTPGTAATGLANPASENCVAKGGQVRIETAGDGGQYGVCLFEDNRQCEEWALLRGACPVGGIKVTGYITPQARYCAIRGGDYTVTRQDTPTTAEQGTCKLPDQPTCEALALYDGRCP